MDTDIVKDDGEKIEMLRDQFRLSVIPIAEAEAKKYEIEISKPVMTCISDLAFKYAEQLGKDLELFAQHGNRKTVNMDDVVLAAHRNEHVASLLRFISSEMKEAHNDKKRKKSSNKLENTVVIDGLDM